MKKNIITYSIIFILIMLLQLLLLKNNVFNYSVVGDIVTFLSITFGFYVTSLAIFATSQFVSDLYKITDKNDTTNTLLHTLINNYKFGLTVTLISLIYFIALELFVTPDVNGKIPFNYIAIYPFISFLILNFIFCFKMLNNLVNIIIQDGKRKCK